MLSLDLSGYERDLIHLDVSRAPRENMQEEIQQKKAALFEDCSRALMVMVFCFCFH